MEGRLGSVMIQGKLLRSYVELPSVTRGHRGVKIWRRNREVGICFELEVYLIMLCHIVRNYVDDFWFYNI